jgi:hypothetical protein
MLTATLPGQDGHPLSMANQVERRQDERIQVLGTTDGVLVGSHLSKWVQLMDISKGGLSFCYVATQRLKGGLFELDILSEQVGLSLDRLGIEVVSDMQVGKELFLGFIPIRRCGAQFTELSTQQSRQLGHFIHNIGSVKSQQNIMSMFSDTGATVRGWW